MEKKIWNNPEMTSLSLENTQAQRIHNGVHDGVVYDDLPALWPDGIEGHS